MIDKFLWFGVGICIGIIMANSIIAHHQSFMTYFTGKTFICAEVVDD